MIHVCIHPYVHDIQYLSKSSPPSGPPIANAQAFVLFVRAVESIPGDHLLLRGDLTLFAVMHIAFAARCTFDPMDCCALALI